jgi:hypothetical protein
MKLVETVLRRWGRIKEKHGGGKSRYILRTFKCHNVPWYNYNMLINKKIDKTHPSLE